MCHMQLLRLGFTTGYLQRQFPWPRPHCSTVNAATLRTSRFQLLCPCPAATKIFPSTTVHAGAKDAPLLYPRQKTHKQNQSTGLLVSTCVTTVTHHSRPRNVNPSQQLVTSTVLRLWLAGSQPPSALNSPATHQSYPASQPASQPAARTAAIKAISPTGWVAPCPPRSSKPAAACMWMGSAVAAGVQSGARARWRRRDRPIAWGWRSKLLVEVRWGSAVRCGAGGL
jgi:hypothetical protein